jgi:hypothetical protein
MRQVVARCGQLYEVRDRSEFSPTRVQCRSRPRASVMNNIGSKEKNNDHLGTRIYVFQFGLVCAAQHAVRILDRSIGGCSSTPQNSRPSRTREFLSVGSHRDPISGPSQAPRGRPSCRPSGTVSSRLGRELRPSGRCCIRYRRWAESGGFSVFPG